jgi:hypothetical protein
VDKKDLKIERLKNIIYNQKMALYHYEIPNCNCPWQYGYVKSNNDECKGTCRECKKEFWDKLRNKVKIEVDEL